MSGAAPAGLDHRHPRRRPARPHAGAGRRPARLPHRRSSSRSRTARPRRSPTGRSSPPMTTPAALAELAQAMPRSSPTSSRTCRSPPPTGLPRAVPVYPPPRALAVAPGPAGREALPQRHRHVHARLSPSTTTPSSPAALAALRRRGVLKTRRLGYDGKGQRVFRDAPADSRRRLRGAGRRAADPRGARRLRARDLGDRGARQRRRGSPPTIRPRTSTATASCTRSTVPAADLAGDRRGRARRTPSPSSRRSTMSA